MSSSGPMNPSQGKGAEHPNGETFKQKLDRIAAESQSSNKQSGAQPHPVVQKVKEYIPAVGQILGGQEQDETKEEESAPSGPPERPHHDVHIEEFVRDQHRSKKEDGVLEG